jgi:lysozyme family protein
MVASLTAALGQRQAETMLQLAVRDCGKRLFVDGQIGRVTIAVANRIPERQLLEALRRRAEPKGA